MDVVAGPQQTPPRVSLISSAELVPVESDRWISGFNAELDGHGGASTFPVCPAEDSEFTVTATGGIGSFKPYMLYATDKATTYGTTERDFFGRAQRKLLAGESTALEAILWSGYAGELNNNPYLSDGAGNYAVDIGVTDSCSALSPTITIASDVTEVMDAFAILEQAIGESSGARGMIHMRPMAFHALVAADLVRREGNVWLSPLDNIVVPGRGYPGTGPAGQAVGATEWMYGHAGVVQIRRGAVMKFGEDDLASQINRGWNDRQAIAQRAAHVLLDPTTQVYAIDFNSLGQYSGVPSAVFEAFAVTASNTADVDTNLIYGWNFEATGAAGDVTVTLAGGEVFVINLAAGETVTYLFPSPVSTTNVEYTSSAGVTGSIFVAP